MTAPFAPVEATTLIDELVAVGVLEPADVQIADVLARSWPDADVDPLVRLGVALAVRAPRLGHVCCDLSLVAASVTAEAPASGGRERTGGEALGSLRWPTPDRWRDAVAASAMVSVADGWGDSVGDSGTCPLVLSGTRLYLQRYWTQEAHVAERLLALASTAVDPGDASAVASALLPGESAVDQRLAVERALTHRLGVIAGGPGTGKTTTIAALLVAALAAAGDPPPRVVLAAPTGKAAARVNEALRGALAGFASSPPPALGDSLPAALDALTGVEATTLHRLLGAGGGPRASYRHDSRNPLPYDVVVVDEASMVALPMMAHLLDAIAPDARVVLVGDPHQLASVEAGSVLADIVGPILASNRGDDGASVAEGPLADVVTVLRRNFRFSDGSGIASLATAVNAGDPAAVVTALETANGILWHPVDPASSAGRVAVLEEIAASGEYLVDAARRGDSVAALESLERCQLLCAHRRGPYGVEQWNRYVGARLGVGAGAPAGRPVLVTRNDPALGVFNGDVGVEVAEGARRRIAFADGDQAVRSLAPVQLEHLEVAHALTIHKSQGSEFDDVVVVLPPASSRLASRELLYTAVTRARSRVVVVGTTEAVAAAVGRRLERQGGLAARLWGGSGPD